MKTIEIDGRQWRDPLDFYKGLLAALRAPDWHGRNINALIDSIIVGSINEIEPPYRIRVTGLDVAGEGAIEELTYAFNAIGKEGAIIRISDDEATLELKHNKIQLQFPN